jgi:hypothetical protein
MLKRSAVACMITLTILSLTQPAFAGSEGDHSPTPGAGESNGQPVAIVALDASGGTVAAIQHPGPGRSGHWTCEYLSGIEGSGVVAAFPITPTTGETVILRCTDDTGTVVLQKDLVYNPADPLPGIDVPAQAAAQALAALVLPNPAVTLDPPLPADQLVGVPTWLADTNWGTLTAAATLDGVTATVTATPTRVTWTTDPDGLATTCTGPGTRYDPSRPPDSQTTTCSLTFEQPGPHRLTATVTYAITWTATTGDGGPLDPLTRATTIPVTVDQAQALIN